MRPRVAGRMVQEPAAPVRHWPRRIALSMVMGGLGLAGWGVAQWMVSPQTLPITEVVVEGTFVHLDRGRLEALARGAVSGGFFSADIAAVASAIAEDPWVRSVGIHREWPGRLRIGVSEQVAVAYWGEDGLLNAEGVAFRPARESFPQGLPHLDGAPGRERELLVRHAQAAAVFAALEKDVVSLVEDARRAATLRLAGGTEIVMGRGRDDGRLARLVRVWPRIGAHREEAIRSIDLRYTNGFAVAWANAAKAAM